MEQAIDEVQMKYCKIEDEMQQFVRHKDNPRVWVCCSCRFTTDKPLKKRPLKEIEGKIRYI